MASLSVRRQLSSPSTRISLKEEASSRGLDLPFSVYQLLTGVRSRAVVWRGFKHRWEYNHRLNRFGSYVRSRDEGRWAVGHTAASGSGPDTAHVVDFYSAVKSPHVMSKPGVRSFSIVEDQGTLATFEVDVQVPIGGIFANKDRYAAVLNGFDLVADNGANKMMEFTLNAGYPEVSNDGQHLTFSLSGSFKGHCSTPECGGVGPVHYDLEVYFLVLAGDTEYFNVVRAPEKANQYEWGWETAGDEIFAGQTGHRNANVPIDRNWEGAGVTNVPGLHHISVDLEKTGGHPALSRGEAVHMLEWDMAIPDIQTGSASADVDLLLFFKNWTQGMKSAHFPHSQGALKDAGRAKLEAGVTLLQVKEAKQHDEEQSQATITWSADADASSEKARSERSLTL